MPVVLFLCRTVDSVELILASLKRLVLCVYCHNFGTAILKVLLSSLTNALILTERESAYQHVCQNCLRIFLPMHLHNCRELMILQNGCRD